MSNSQPKTNPLQGNLLLMLGALVFLFVPIGLGTYGQSIFILVAFYAFAASAWNLVCGFVGTLSLGHAAFAGIGGYISTLLLIEASLSPWIGMFIGAIITALVGVLIGFPCFRLQGPYFTLTSIALAEIIRIWVENNETLFGIDIKGSMGLLLPQTGNQAIAFEFANKLSYYYIILAFLAIAIFITWHISRNKLGHYLVAIRSDAAAAESLGIPLVRYRLIAMGLSCFLMSFAGTFYAQYYRYIGPTRIFGSELSVRVALIALVGGQGTTLGPLFGAIILVPLTELLSGYFGGTLPGLHLFIYGVAMIVVIMYMPGGIHNYIRRLFNWVESKVFKSKTPAKSEA